MLLAPFDQKCIALVNESPNRHSRNCFRSAINHLEMAEKIVEIDPIMAAFRGLTAEEEAASGLMHCIKEKGYKNANKLKPRDHVHKNAVSPFLDILGMFFAETIKAHVKKPALRLETTSDKTHLMLGLLMTIEGEDKWAWPVPPLNFTVTTEDKKMSYRRQIEFLVEHRGAKNISEYIRNHANFRNKLLYASPEGFPAHVSNVSESLKDRQVRVMALVRGYLMIEPYPENLTFVQDSLNAFLAMMGELKEHDLHGKL